MVIGQLVFYFTVNKYPLNEFVCINEKTKTHNQNKEQNIQHCVDSLHLLLLGN